MKKNIFITLLASLLYISCSESNISNQSADSKKKEVLTALASSENATKKKGVVSKNQSPIDTNYIMGKFDPKNDPRFIKVAPIHANTNNRLLRKETYEAFIKMYDAAKKENITLQIISATRNFAAQKGIWEGKWTGTRLHESKENLAKTTPNPRERALKILRWSSMPGTSRHHWGTDIDLNSLDNDFFEKGKGLEIYNWLTTNAPAYGFCQPYSSRDTRPYGYNEEKWHWSYLPIAKKLTEQAKRGLQNEMIRGFKGSETAVSIGVVDTFILGISGECL